MGITCSVSVHWRDRLWGFCQFTRLISLSHNFINNRNFITTYYAFSFRVFYTDLIWRNFFTLLVLTKWCKQMSYCWSPAFCHNDEASVSVHQCKVLSRHVAINERVALSFTWEDSAFYLLPTNMYVLRYNRSENVLSSPHIESDSWKSICQMLICQCFPRLS
jgi:hypothetical protein